MFNDLELKRYSRHIFLPHIGIEGQKKLCKAKVLCIGVGGLGVPVSQYLAAAGIGLLGLVDHDVVELSNLQRQPIYRSQDIGYRKVEVASAYLKNVNNRIEILPYPNKIYLDNAIDIISPYDIIVDCTDNFSAKYLINDVCRHLNKINVHGSIFQFEGQCTVFDGSKGPCYRCIYQKPPVFVQNCDEAGVVGVLPGLIGIIQATEVIKSILHIGKTLTNKLLIVDALTMDFRKLNTSQSEECLLCSNQINFGDYSYNFSEDCHIDLHVDEISVEEYKKINLNNNIFLLDVRDPWERKIKSIGGHLIPLQELNARINELNKKYTIIVYCESGKRSVQAARILKNKGFESVIYLKGGIIAYLNKP